MHLVSSYLLSFGELDGKYSMEHGELFALGRKLKAQERRKRADKSRNSFDSNFFEPTHCPLGYEYSLVVVVLIVDGAIIVIGWKLEFNRGIEVMSC